MNKPKIGKKGVAKQIADKFHKIIQREKKLARRYFAKVMAEIEKENKDK